MAAPPAPANTGFKVKAPATMRSPPTFFQRPLLYVKRCPFL